MQKIIKRGRTYLILSNVSLLKSDYSVFKFDQTLPHTRASLYKLTRGLLHVYRRYHSVRAVVAQLAISGQCLDISRSFCCSVQIDSCFDLVPRCI